MLKQLALLFRWLKVTTSGKRCFLDVVLLAFHLLIVGSVFRCSVTQAALATPSSATPGASASNPAAQEAGTTSRMFHIPASYFSFVNILWPGICQVLFHDENVHATISCHVTPRDAIQWRLDSLRSSLEQMELGLDNGSFPELRTSDGQLRVALNISCKHGGNISLPYPMRSPGLVKLTIRGCRLLDKYTDVGTPAEMLADTLEVLDMQNCTWVTGRCSLSYILDVLPNVTDHFQCGQDSTLRSLLYRDIRDEIQFNVEPASAAEGAASKNCSVDIIGALEVLKVLQDKPLHCNFERLQIMDESGTSLTSKRIFEFMARNSLFPALRQLNYSRIGMTEVPRELLEWHRWFPELRVLDLSHNSIQEFAAAAPHDTLYNVSLMVDLQYNNITKISMMMFRDWATIAGFFVDIRGNPINCDCDFGDFLRDFLDEKQWAGSQMKRYRDMLSIMTCATPMSLAGRGLKSLAITDLPCPTGFQDLRVPMIVVSVVLVVIVVLLVLVLRYRREICILLYTRLHVLLPCGFSRFLSGATPDKRYDAFIAYAHEDSDWVLHCLLPRLEAPSGISSSRTSKLCVHQRDFMAGKPIIDNIIDSIVSSRYTIAVLTPSFVRSFWGLEELHQAYRQSLEERRRHLVMVVLEEVPQSEMNSLLLRCRKTFSSLYVSDNLFWDRLLSSISADDEDSVIAERTIRNESPDIDRDSAV